MDNKRRLAAQENLDEIVQNIAGSSKVLQETGERLSTLNQKSDTLKKTAEMFGKCEKKKRKRLSFCCCC